MINLEDIKQAQQRICEYAVVTPLLRMPMLDSKLGCQVFVKAENMQVTGAFKFRGALNKALSLTSEQLEAGLVCASSGNHGKALTYTGKLLGARVTVVMPHTAPQIKVDAIKALGGNVVQCHPSERFELAESICSEQGATLVPPYNDEFVMAGQGTCGLEIAQQLPEVDKVIVPVSGGGLIGGVATALKETLPQVSVIGAEPAVLPRYSTSLKAGKVTSVEYSSTIADALVSQAPGPKCFPNVQKHVDYVAGVSEDHVLKGMKLLLTEGKLLAEPSSGIGMGGVLEGVIDVKPQEKVCFLVSGGSVGIGQLAQLKNIQL